MFFPALALLVSAVMFISCTGEDGAIGPAGAKGDTGAKGDKGDAGTANVIYSPWLSFPAITVNTATVKAFTFDAPQITQEVIDKGTILVYGKPASGTTIQPLPYVSYWVENGSVVGMIDNSINFEPQKFTFSRVFMGDIKTVPIRFANSTSSFFDKIRYVIIPGGVPTGRQAAVDYNNYEAVKKYYNLAD